MDKYDVVVIGAGPGGYVAAIRCAQLGLKCACIESRINDEGQPALGGTCLNVGCIPSKALLESSHQFQFIREEAGRHGITTAGVSLDVAKMQHRKAGIVKTLTQGISGLFNKHNIAWLRGHGRLLDQGRIEITPLHEAHAEKKTLAADHIIIATGSAPMRIPPARVDNQRIVDSSGALNFTEVPRRLGIIGAGVIGLELGSVWQRLGARVTLLEALPDFLAPVDRHIAQAAAKTFRGQGLDIRLGARVTGTGSNQHEVTVNYQDGEGRQQLVVDRLIVAAGRSPNTAGLGAAECGLELDQRGFIKVDALARASLENVYAIGDVAGGAMLAHKAAEEGVALAERIAGRPGRMNHDTIPWVIYTWPEIAWVGKNEAELKAAGVAYQSGRFPFMASGRARTGGETTGFVKLLSEAKTDRLLGAHIFGPHASELIAEAVLTMEFEGASEDLARTIHAHPTLSEAMHEAALAVDGRAIHI